MHGDDHWPSTALPDGFIPNDERDAFLASASTGIEAPLLAQSRGSADPPDDKYKRRQEVQRRYREKVKAKAAEREAALESARREMAQLRAANAALSDMVSALEKLDMESSALTAVLHDGGGRGPAAGRPNAALDPHPTLPALDALQLAKYAMDISFNPDVAVTDEEIHYFIKFPAEVMAGIQIEFIRRLETHMQEWAVCYSSRLRLERTMASGMRNRFRVLQLMSHHNPDTHIKVMKKVSVPPGSPAAAAAAQRMAGIVTQLGLNEQQRAALKEALRQFKDSINAIRADAAMAQMTLASLAEMGGPSLGPGPGLGASGAGMPMMGGMPGGMPGAGLTPAQLAALRGAAQAPSAPPGAGPAGAAGRRPRKVSARAAAAAETAALIGDEPPLGRAFSSGSEGSGHGSVMGGLLPPGAPVPGPMVSMAQRAQDALAATDALATMQRLPHRMLHARTVITIQTLGALSPVQAAQVILGSRPSIPDHALLCKVATSGLPLPPGPPPPHFGPQQPVPPHPSQMQPGPHPSQLHPGPPHSGPPQPGPPRPSQLPWPFN